MSKLVYYSSQELAKILKVSEEDFHRQTKRLIKKDFENELKKIAVTNPDILLNENKIIFLADPRDHNNFVNTNLSIFDYI
jgi:hypothetical protein